MRGSAMFERRTKQVLLRISPTDRRQRLFGQQDSEQQRRGFKRVKRVWHARVEKNPLVSGKYACPIAGLELDLTFEAMEGERACHFV